VNGPTGWNIRTTIDGHDVMLRIHHCDDPKAVARWLGMYLPETVEVWRSGELIKSFHTVTFKDIYENARIT